MCFCTNQYFTSIQMVFSVFLPCYEPVPMYLVIVLVCASLSLADEPYCAVRYRRLCQGKGRHVACQFPTEWDRELAFLAQRLADQCLFVHDDCRATVRYPYAGQTVGEVRLRRLSDSDELSAHRAIRRVFDAWWGERRRVDPRQLTQPFKITAKGSVWGHFSQLAAWSLRAAGCGAVRHGNAQPRLLLVCDFSHTNMLGQRTLTPGKLAPCPDHTQRRPQSTYPLLCASVRNENNEQIKQTTEEYIYDEYDDEFSTEITTRQSLYYAPSEGHRRMPVEDRFLAPTTMVTETEDFTEDVESTKLMVVPASKEIMDFTPMSDSFYNKLAVRLRPGKGHEDESRRKSERRPMKGIRRYTVEDQSTRAEDRYTLTAGLHKALEEDQVPLRAKTQMGNPAIFGKWQTRKLNLVKWHDPEEDDHEHQSKEYQYIKNNIDLSQELSRERDPGGTRRPNVELLNGRHKWSWKQNRERPQRPGAAALLHIKKPELPTETIPVPPPTAPPFLMDDEDVHQLFRDTGFHPSWRKSKT